MGKEFKVGDRVKLNDSALSFWFGQSNSGPGTITKVRFPGSPWRGTFSNSKVSIEVDWDYLLHDSYPEEALDLVQEFKKGDIVVLSAVGLKEFGHQASDGTEGTIENVDRIDEFCFYVKWNNSRSHHYRKVDLILAKTENKFKVNDRVKLNTRGLCRWEGQAAKDESGTITRINSKSWGGERKYDSISITWDKGFKDSYPESDIEKVNPFDSLPVDFYSWSIDTFGLKVENPYFKKEKELTLEEMIARVG